MQGYVVLLRGINTGKLNIKKEEIKALLSLQNFNDFLVIGHTGNIIIYTDLSIDEIKQRMSDALENFFGQSIWMHIRTVDALKNMKALIKPITEGMQHYIIFCEEDAKDALYAYYQSLSQDIEEVYVIGNDLYWMTPKGYTLKGFGKIALGRAKYKKIVTSRNVNTILKIIEALEND